MAVHLVIVHMVGAVVGGDSGFGPDRMGFWGRWWGPVLIGAALLVAVAWSVCTRWLHARDAAGAVWVQVTPPAALPSDAAVRFARSLAGVLHRTRRYPWRVRSVACEFVATDAGVRLGVWVPPAIAPRAVAEAVTGAWPGALVTVTAPPTLTGAGGVCGREVCPRGGPWSPVTDPSARAVARPEGVDPLGQVLTALAERPAREVGIVQVIVAAQRATDGIVRPTLRLLLDGAASLMTEVGRELMSDGKSGRAPRPTTPVDPVQAQRAREIVAKKASGPHLRVTVRAAVSGPVPARYRRQAAGWIANGYDAVATAGNGLTGHRTRGAARKVSLRRPGTVFAATVGELGALWHIPADAAVYGIDTTTARWHDPRRDLPRLATPPRHPDVGHGRSGENNRHEGEADR
ncbi:hypothetical protein IU500_33905 [Nocardia terpenica]|uniref:hypothetical protein n=1 Tax=Nocardia terpenica TaxID=455432 RepID=UPI0018961A06|nr:hypothetical protein [Nocardia terpenica]MBF6066062.1 hypothetical protein [Nocardia terpenica]MBF6109011.1 hypothetical protein [Nocardia terpenica]MBF6116306.1 hypothetical protein [Nocardia terpenica]MBF6123307.1 hypothetical protein [Nocardia terpenica]MBF6156510.1 hypothetical protein [Nocardia terpenica]